MAVLQGFEFPDLGDSSQESLNFITRELRNWRLIYYTFAIARLGRIYYEAQDEILGKFYGSFT
jgi:hypothetical protein